MLFRSYDAVTDGQRLHRSLSRRGERLLPVSFDEAIADAAQVLSAVKRESGANAIAVLGSPLTTNEEAAALARLARDVIGTPHLDFSHGPIHRAAIGAFTDAFGVAQLPNGEVLAVKLKKSSGMPALDAAIERAVLKSAPLPRPDSGFAAPREFELKYKPLD